MKRIISLLMIISILVCVIFLSSCSNDSSTNNNASYSSMRVAFITDSGEITDQSFNQSIYEGCKKYTSDNNIDFQYFKPSSDADEDFVIAIEQAIDKNYNVIVASGYKFARALKQTINISSNIYFLAIDLSKNDFDKSFEIPENLCCCVYNEEIAGFLAGYTAVKLGYKKLGFLGGMAVPAVVRYGYGFIQGANSAAKIDNVSDVNIKYGYGNQYFGDTDITAAMDTWYKSGTELVFSCGGAIYTSVAESASKVNGKIIGVDTDQKNLIDDTYGEGMTVTSAVKGIPNTIYMALECISNKQFCRNLGGKYLKLGIVDDDIDSNYVGIAYQSTQFNDKYTLDDYKTLVKEIHQGDICVSDDITKNATDFATDITVDFVGNIK